MWYCSFGWSGYRSTKINMTKNPTVHMVRMLAISPRKKLVFEGSACQNPVDVLFSS